MHLSCQIGTQNRRIAQRQRPLHNSFIAFPFGSQLLQQVPANRFGYGRFTGYQLKIIQDAITLVNTSSNAQGSMPNAQCPMPKAQSPKPKA